MALNYRPSLDYVVLRCRDVQAARGFYRHVMGLSITQERDDWIEFRIGTSVLVLRPLGECARDGREQGSQVQLGFRVSYDEVDACHKKLKARGVEVLDPPADQGWGHRTLFFVDPEGNLLEVYAELPGEHAG